MNGCQRKSSMENYVGKRSHGGQKKRYKDPFKASLKGFNIPTESWEQIALVRTKWRGFIRRDAGEYEANESAKPSRNVHSEKPELTHHQHSSLAQTFLVPSVTGSLELILVLSAFLEHISNNTTHSWLGLVIVSNNRLSTIILWLCCYFKTIIIDCFFRLTLNVIQLNYTYIISTTMYFRCSLHLSFTALNAHQGFAKNDGLSDASMGELKNRCWRP